jgi:hypothetical protein
MALQVLTANRLRDGVVVYFDSDGGWSERIAAARVVEAANGDALVAAAAPTAREVVAPYLIDVEAEADGIMPRRYRERIRAFGPSIHPEFAK